MAAIVYPFRMSERIVFAEIYFPKRAAYYGAIFKALREGHDEQKVKEYLRLNAAALLEELKDYRGLLDPKQYESDVRADQPLTVADAQARIALYQSSFQGWSTYGIDGVFFGTGSAHTTTKTKQKPRTKKEQPREVMVEEAVQIVRIMMRFCSSFEEQATAAGCKDVLRAILYRTITRIGRLDEETGWSLVERDLFLAEHVSWTESKRAFAEKHFCAIAREAQKWVDDCALLVIGYLVRQFWQHVVAERMYEEEIWITSLFTMNLNVIKREERQ